MRRPFSTASPVRDSGSVKDNVADVIIPTTVECAWLNPSVLQAGSPSAQRLWAKSNTPKQAAAVGD